MIGRQNSSWLDSSVAEFLLWVPPICKRSWVQIPVQPFEIFGLEVAALRDLRFRLSGLGNEEALALVATFLHCLDYISSRFHNGEVPGP